ncbi:MAG: response regulator [Leptolyngbyaceae cyanobacterium]
MSEVLNVLIIEDSEDDALLVVRALCRGQLQPNWERVQTAESVYEMLTTGSWDIVLSDYNLPGFDAPAALEIVKRLKPELPFIVISGTIGEERAVAMMRLGVNDYLMKDSLARLPEAVRREVQEAQNRVENQKTRAELSQSKATSSAIINAIPDLLMSMNRNGHYRYMGNGGGITSICPYDENAVFSVNTTLPPEMAEKRLAATSRALDTGVLQVYEQALQIDGIDCYEEVRVAPLNDDQVLIMVRDVSDRRRAENGLRDAEECYRNMFQGALVGIYQSTLSGQYLEVNPALAKIYGYDSPQILKAEINDIDQQIYVDPVARKDLLRQIQNNGSSTSFQCQVFQKDGRKIWINETGKFIMNSNGEPVYYEGFVQDITTQKESELTLRRLVTGTAAFTGEAFFPILARCLTEVLDVRHAIIAEYENNSLNPLSFWSDKARQEPYSLPLNASYCCQETLRRQFFKHAIKKTDNPTDTILHTHLNSKGFLGIALLNSDLRPIGLLCVLDDDPILDPSQQADAILQVFAARASAELEQQQTNRQLSDLAQSLEEKVAERTIALTKSNKDLHDAIQHYQETEKALRLSETGYRLARDEAEKANQAKSEFLALMSHEIRTPMNAILGLLYLTLKTPVSLVQKDYLEKSQVAAKSLLKIINDILDFSKIEAGKFELESYEFSLNKVLRQVTDMMLHKASQKHLEVLLDTHPAIPDILIGDSLRLAQIITNLTSNSLKFTDNGEVVIIVKPIKQSTTEITLRFGVRDTGIGMSKEQTQRLFEPFTQVDISAKRRYEGTGLGLSICKRLVEQMQGKIWVESQLNCGSVFWFDIVLGVGAQKFTLTLSPGSLPQSLQKLSCLVVDNNPTSQEILKHQLMAMGYQVDCAISGVEALRKIKQNEDTPYQLMIIDLWMPMMSGLELIQSIQKQANVLSSKIVLVTAYSGNDLVAQAENLGISTILQKPITANTLLLGISEAFGISQQLTCQTRFISTIRTTDFSVIKGGKVLLVEDNENNQQIAVEILGSTGLEIEVARNGQEAMDRVKMLCFDLILMDIRMPGMDGLEVTRRIRDLAREGEVASERFATVPIVAMSANALQGDREAGLAAGMNDYLTKPIDPERLYSALLRWIPRQHLERQSAVPSERMMSQKSEADLSNLPVLDCYAALKRLGGNQEIYQGVLKQFVQQHQNSTDLFRIAEQHQDWQAGGELAHSIKGISANIGAQSLANIAMNLESAFDSCQTEVILVLLPIFSQQLESVIEAIKEFGVDSESKNLLKIQKEFNEEETRALLCQLENALKADLGAVTEKIKQLRQPLQSVGLATELQAVENYFINLDMISAAQALKHIENSLRESNFSG